MEITSDIIIQLSFEMKRSGVEIDELVDRLGTEDAPPDFRPDAVREWLNHPGREVPDPHFDFVITRLRSYATTQKWIARSNAGKKPRHDGERVRLTEALLEKLRAEKDRTLATPDILLQGRQDIPDGLTAPALWQWIYGNAKSVPREHLDYVLTLWGQLDDLVRITPEIRRLLVTEYGRMRVYWDDFLKAHSPCPEGLTVKLLLGWTNGSEKKAKRELLEFVLDRLTAVPEGQPST